MSPIGTKADIALNIRNVCFDAKWCFARLNENQACLTRISRPKSQRRAPRRGLSKFGGPAAPDHGGKFFTLKENHLEQAAVSRNALSYAGRISVHQTLSLRCNKDFAFFADASGSHAAWKPSKAFWVTQTRSGGRNPNSRVHEEKHKPSITTLSP